VINRLKFKDNVKMRTVSAASIPALTAVTTFRNTLIVQRTA